MRKVVFFVLHIFISGVTMTSNIVASLKVKTTLTWCWLHFVLVYLHIRQFGLCFNWMDMIIEVFRVGLTLLSMLMFPPFFFFPPGVIKVAISRFKESPCCDQSWHNSSTIYIFFLSFSFFCSCFSEDHPLPFFFHLLKQPVVLASFLTWDSLLAVFALMLFSLGSLGLCNACHSGFVLDIPRCVCFAWFYTTFTVG